jgi:cytochrome b6-f complex iron-sulfur subunit
MDEHREQETGGKIARRTFLKALAASGGAAALAGCAAKTEPASSDGGSPEITLDLSRPENQALSAVGGTLILEANAVDSKGLLLVRSGETMVRAFSRKCTHTGCTVGGFEEGISSCPCHGSQFGTDGRPVKGPAAAPLKEYPASFDGSILTVRG